MSRRSYKGAAPPTTTTSAIDASPATIPIADGTGWPTTPAFVVTLERLVAGKIEKKLVTRSGLVLTVIQNGFDDTTDQSHSTGATIEHTISAADLNEANNLVNLADAKGDLLVATAADIWAKKAVGADGTILVPDATQSDGWNFKTPSTLGLLEKTLADAKGDLIVASAADAFVRQAAGANSTFLVYDSVQASGVKAASLVIPMTHTWAIAGEIKVPSGDTDFIIPMAVMVPAGWTAVLARVRYKINSGTSVTFKMQKNGADATGFTALSATTTAATTDPSDVALADLDLLVPVVTAVSDTPKNLMITADVRLTYAG